MTAPVADPAVLTILVVDDEPSICWALRRMLTDEGHDVLTASSAEEGLRLAGQNDIAMVFLDVRLPELDGLSALPRFLDATNAAPVIVMTAFGDLQTAVGAVRGGAVDYLTKPFSLADATRVCRQALAGRHRLVDASESADQPRSGDDRPAGELIGKSPAMQRVFRQIALVADSDLSVLITGETGTGKELVAAAIHRHSRRAGAAYVPIAPVALHPDLVESELFGHVRGAFTGATGDREGLFERADGGTVLLDEIGDLPAGTQVKLLRVLEQGQFSRVGETQVRTADVRILAATNIDLNRNVAAGNFREDLFYRLSGMQIQLPPLRDRAEDLRPLCEHFLASMRDRVADALIHKSTLDELARRPWHGNVRELKNAVQHAAVVARGRPLTIDDFPPPQPGRDSSEASSTASATDELAHAVRRWAREQTAEDSADSAKEDDQRLHSRFLAATEPHLFAEILKHTGGNRARAAESLGIHRGTLRERLRTFGMDE